MRGAAVGPEPRRAARRDAFGWAELFGGRAAFRQAERVFGARRGAFGRRRRVFGRERFPPFLGGQRVWRVRRAKRRRRKFAGPKGSGCPLRVNPPHVSSTESRLRLCRPPGRQRGQERQTSKLARSLSLSLLLSLLFLSNIYIYIYIYIYIVQPSGRSGWCLSGSGATACTRPSPTTPPRRDSRLSTILKIQFKIF